MILVTGAAGKTGRSIIRRLSKNGKDVKAFVYRPEYIPQIEALGAKEILSGDMQDREIVRKAMQSVSSVYHICPNMHPDEYVIGQIMIEAAKSARISHFIFHSVLHPQIEAMPHHWNKMRVEERLFESGLPFTILQPAAYMQNVIAQWDSILETGNYVIPYSVSSRIAMVDLEDVALTAMIILGHGNSRARQNIHHGATYELIGETAISQDVIASILSQQLDRPIVAKRKPIDVWEREASSSDVGSYQINTLKKMFDYYEMFGFMGSTSVLSWLLERQATSFRTFINRMIEERQGTATRI